MFVKIKDYIPLKLIKIIFFATILNFSAAQVVYDPRTENDFYKRIDDSLEIIMTNVVPILLFYTLSPPDVKVMSNKIGLIDDALYIILPSAYEAYQGIATFFCEKTITFSLYSLMVFIIYLQFTLSVYVPKYRDILWVAKLRELIVDMAVPSYYVIFFVDNTLFILGLFHAKRPEIAERHKFVFLYSFITILIPMLWHRLRHTLHFFGRNIWIFYLFLLGLIMFLIKTAIAQSSHNLVTKFITNFIIAQFIRMTFLTYNNNNDDDHVHGLHRHWIDNKKKRTDYEALERNKNSWWFWFYLFLMLVFILLIAFHTFYDFGLKGYYFDIQYWTAPKCTSILN
jgi:hypothetical protein